MLGDVLRIPSERQKPMKSSKPFNVVPVEISWGNLEDMIAVLLQSETIGKIPKGHEIVKIILDHPGGEVARGKVLSMKVVTRKGVQVFKH